MESWFEIGKLLASAATPVIVAIVGVLLLRRVEGIKALVSKQSDFDKKWADEFFSCCQQFVQSLEKELAWLTALCGPENSSEKMAVEIKEEISRLNVALPELVLRIRRYVVFAPTTGATAFETASECFSLTARLLQDRQGNLDEIIEKMNAFNVACRKSHAEMLGLNRAG